MVAVFRVGALVGAIALVSCQSRPNPSSESPQGSTSVALTTASSTPDKEPPPEGPVSAVTRPRTVYVPAYSHVARGTDPRKRSMLSILLSVRNVDSSADVTLTHVDYFDTSGHRVRRYLSAPRTLRPLETAEFAVDALDEAGGSGANFLVYWEGPADAHSLLTETVMIGHLGPGHVAFTSRGVELDRRPDPSAFVADDGAE